MYNRASQVVSLAENQITAAVTSVTLPVLSRYQDDRQRFNAFLNRAVTALGFTLVPAFFALSICAVPLVTLIYGPQWTTAGDLLVLLALAGTVRSLLLVVELAATALAVMSRQLIMTVTLQLITAMGLVVAASISLRAVALVYVVGTAVSVIVGAIWISAGTIINVATVGRRFARPFILWSAAYACGRVSGSVLGLGTAAANAAVALSVFIAVGVLMCLVWPQARRDLLTVIEIVRNARGPRISQAEQVDTGV